MFEVKVKGTIGEISKFEETAMQCAIGSCNRITELNNNDVINVKSAILFDVHNDRAENTDYECAVFKTEHGFYSTGSRSCIESIFESSIINELFNEIPEDKQAIAFQIAKIPSKNNSGSFIKLLPLAYV